MTQHLTPHPTPEFLPPSVSATMIDKVVGKAKEVAGTILGDEDLKAEGHLHEARAAATAEALKQEAAAAQREAEAEVLTRQRELAAEAARLNAEEANGRNEEQLELERQRAEAAAAAEQQAHAAELHTRDAVKEVAVDVRETEAFRERIAAESEAERLEREALAAREHAQLLDPANTPPAR